jgi:hypothetical protein
VDGRDKPGHDGEEMLRCAREPINVMPGLVPGIYVFQRLKTWMAGINPAMTVKRCCAAPGKQNVRCAREKPYGFLNRAPGASRSAGARGGAGFGVGRSAGRSSCQ